MNFSVEPLMIRFLTRKRSSFYKVVKEAGDQLINTKVSFIIFVLIFIAKKVLEASLSDTKLAE